MAPSGKFWMAMPKERVSAPAAVMVWVPAVQPASTIPTAMPSGILWRVTASISMVFRLNWERGPSGSGLFWCRWGMVRSRRRRNRMPSQNPMAAGRKAHWPRDADWFMEGMRRLHMEAAVMTPAAKPVRARRRLVRRVPFIRKTQAEPKVVPRKGRRMPCRMFAVMGREVLSFLLVWVGFAEMHYIMRGRDRSSRPPEAFPYPVFGRFAYRVSALVGHTLFGCLAGFACWTFFASVRQYQTACARTAGHWISEKPPAAG